MQRLLEQCLFHNEYDHPAGQDCAEAVDLDCVQRYVEHRKARLVAVNDAVVSVSVKESGQGDVKGLFCGARTLLIEKESGNVVLRGVNKFFDLEEVDSAWTADPTVWCACAVYAQRKLAGFVVTLFSDNGVEVGCMSKHSLDGPHVAQARSLLKETLTAEQLSALARDLHQRDAAAACECVDLTTDFQHPVLEDSAFDRKLILFSVHKRRSVREMCVPFEEVKRLATAWGLQCAPDTRLHSAAALDDALAAVGKWNAEFPLLGSPTQLAEGLVILIEIPSSYFSVHAPTTGDSTVADAPWVTPVRLKAKTVRYVALRSLRSLIRNDSQPRVLLLHKAIAAWAVRAGKGAAELRALEEEVGVHAVYTLFQKDMSEQAGKRFRGCELSVTEALARLLSVTEQQLAGRAARANLTALLLCGLPGTGKTTVCEALLRAAPAAFDYGVVLSRDSTTQAVMKALGLTANSSKHKKRRIGFPVHREMQRRLETLESFCAVTEAHVLLMFDACNATPDTRRVWRRAVPAPSRNVHTVFLHCSDEQALANRVVSRESHELLTTGVEGRRALYNVRQKFVPPLAKEQTLDFDTAPMSATEIAEALVTRLSLEHAPAGGSRRMQSLTFEKAATRVEEEENSILCALVCGDTLGDSPSRSLGSFFTPQRSVSTRRPSVVAVSLATPATALKLIAAGAVVAAMQRTVCESAASGSVVCGHARWLKGWLFRSHAIASVDDVEVRRALDERFAHTPMEPHMTLLYSPHGEASLNEFWQSSGVRLNERVRVRIAEVLLDRSAVCFSASLVGSQRACQWPADGTADSEASPASEAAAAPPPPLHVTVATADGVKGDYCGSMFANFTHWEADNAALQLKQEQGRASRSKDKYANFVRLRLSSPVELDGVVQRLDHLSATG